jgi:Tol biopolymer transport system component
LTFKGRNRKPLWSRDGKSVTFFSSRAPPDTSGLYRVPADGSGPARLLLTANRNETLAPGGWTLDGRSLIYGLEGRGKRDIGILTLTSDYALTKLYLNESWAEWTPHLSPDGRWVAYASDEGGGNFEVFVRSFPIPGAKYQVSQGGGIIPRWAPDGRTLYYLNRYSGTGGTGMPMAAEVDGRAGFRVLSRRPLPAIAKYRIGGLSGEDYDIHPDGKSLVALKYSNATVPGMMVVLNWFDELKARMGVKQ